MSELPMVTITVQVALVPLVGTGEKGMASVATKTAHLQVRSDDIPADQEGQQRLANELCQKAKETAEIILRMRPGC